MRWKKLGSTENEEGGRNTWFTEKNMEMNMINGQQKQGCLMQKRWLKTIGQEFQVETYKEGG